MKVYSLLAVLIVPSFAVAQPGFDQVVKKAEVKVEPATAKPGQTVTVKLTLQLLDGWHTYPVVQPDKAAKGQTNKITFPEDSPLVFVGEVEDPANPKEKAEPLAMIDSLLYYPGGGTWERKAVVLPSAKPGDATSKIKFKVLVCDKDNCLPPKTLELEAKVKVEGTAVPVDPKYKAEVEKRK